TTASPINIVKEPTAGSKANGISKTQNEVNKAVNNTNGETNVNPQIIVNGKDQANYPGEFSTSDDNASKLNSSEAVSPLNTTSLNPSTTAEPTTTNSAPPQKAAISSWASLLKPTN